MTEARKLIQTQSRGIKCDAIGCDYRDENVTFADLPDWLEKPCPKCGASLLTREALAHAQAMQKAADLINDMAGTLIEKGIISAVDLAEAGSDQMAYITTEYDSNGLPVSIRIATKEEVEQMEKEQSNGR